MTRTVALTQPSRKKRAMSNTTLYARLGGYDAIAAVSKDLVDRLQEDPQLGRFWRHRGEDGLKRELQLLVDFLCAATGGPMYYRGRETQSQRYAHQRKRLERLSDACRRDVEEISSPSSRIR
jgi:truncated hemoglobin YjbI